VSVAIEHTGGDAARPFVEQAGATFPTLVDETGVTVRALDFKVVPNGMLVDSRGTIRWVHLGGFSIDHKDDVQAVERFLTGDEPVPPPAEESPYTLGGLERELIDTKLRLGRLLDSLGRRDEAVTEWREALRLDPGNYVIRKQIWLAQYPERFHPMIDWEWQEEQLSRERAEEIADGICGLDGCPLPAATT
jgi:tetratricopeptide (TPR) repeat protein